MPINVSIFWLTVHEFTESFQTNSLLPCYCGCKRWEGSRSMGPPHWVISVPCAQQGVKLQWGYLLQWEHPLPAHTPTNALVSGEWLCCSSSLAGWLFFKACASVWDSCPSDILACHVIEVTWGVIEGKLVVLMTETLPGTPVPQSNKMWAAKLIYFAGL